MKEIIECGRTVELAIKSGREKIGDPDAEFEVLDMPKKTLFGLKTIPAKVRIFIPDVEVKVEPTEEKKLSYQPLKQAVPQQPIASQASTPVVKKTIFETTPLPVQKPISDTVSEQSKTVQPSDNLTKQDEAIKYVSDILIAMGADNFVINPELKDDCLTLDLKSEDLGFIIGRRGETLDALQYLTGLAVNRGEGDYLRITLDSGNFRQKREQTLESLARRLAKNVQRSGRSITLEPMNPYERRTIHATIATIEGVCSSSTGDEPNRRVIINCTARRSVAPNRYNKTNDNRPVRKTESLTDENHQAKAEFVSQNRPPKKDFDTQNKPPYRATKPPYKNDRRDRPAPYQPTTVRETPPNETNEVKAPLYGKVEL
ncbi:MAG: RNA-binding cell elongation regulator Jag/EloR [Oscillospiraceae bacterium]